jgi:hypothetical protein
MPLFDLRLIVDLIAPTKRVEYSDRQLQHAQALWEENRTVMHSQDRKLAQSLLER